MVADPCLSVSGLVQRFLHRSVLLSTTVWHSTILLSFVYPTVGILVTIVSTLIRDSWISLIVR